MKKEIQKYNIDRPAEVQRMANVVKTYVVKNELFAPIANKNYVLVEGWQFAGGLLGLFPKVVKVEKLEGGAWFAHVDIINGKTDKVVSSGYALCSKDEARKKGFDEYAILSMAQTRAIGKAYRNLIGWVMKLAGYESTPAEEMKDEPIKAESVKSKVAPESTIMTTVKRINESTDKKTLAEWREKIEESTTHNKVQKNLIITTIDKRLEELNG